MIEWRSGGRKIGIRGVSFTWNKGGTPRKEGSLRPSEYLSSKGSVRLGPDYFTDWTFSPKKPVDTA